ncbi:DUF5302 domain-containing protein [Streptomyces sp. NBRC 110028]|uniref:DUF5302 domain-containing protein n=1 Tax=Streptomyces sp. NBRC 110028 TaxID=1621260 RepID=UPI0006E14D73|nr:DUF5302 domain-containing protein [Streptomyces sp. NBRC 110028]
MQDNQGGSGAESESETEIESDVKRKFREALERKKLLSRERRAHEDARSKVNGTSRKGAKKPNFRRKAG